MAAADLRETHALALERYRSEFSLYEQFASRLESLLNDLARNNGIRIHFSESRAKSPDSLIEKLNRPGKAYADPLNEVPDLVGVRLVLYYQDNVPQFGELVGQQFLLIEEEGDHQPERYSPDQFGYLSMHYIVRLNENRLVLPEWAPFGELRAEIQVRTLLQHSWAAVSHVLQYKREGDVPFALRRKLFRLAGLFELADEEFVAIRLARDAIEGGTKLPADGVQGETYLDAPVIREFIDKSKELKRIVSKLADLGHRVSASESNIGEVVEECERLGIRGLRDLEKVVAADHRSFIQKVAKPGWGMDESFVLYLLLISAYADKFDLDYLLAHEWSEDIAERVLAAATRAPA